MRKPLLYLDFETSPIVGWSWQVYDTEVFHIQRDVQIISVAWSWEGEKEVYAMGVHEFPGYKPGILNLNDKKLIEAFLPIFEKAQMVCAHNGKNFDFRLWRTRLIKHGFNPYPEIKELDTKTWARKFKFSNNRQDNISRELGTKRKLSTDKNLHYFCLEEGDVKWWKQMIKYNKQDVVGLKENAHRLAPWITSGLPNANMLYESKIRCRVPTCNSPKMIQMRLRRVKGGRKQQWQCEDCGAYSQSNILIKEPKEPMLV